jgi:hypothetical protein
LPEFSPPGSKHDQRQQEISEDHHQHAYAIQANKKPGAELGDPWKVYNPLLICKQAAP